MTGILFQSRTHQTLIASGREMTMSSEWKGFRRPLKIRLLSLRSLFKDAQNLIVPGEGKKRKISKSTRPASASLGWPYYISVLPLFVLSWQRLMARSLSEDFDLHGGPLALSLCTFAASLSKWASSPLDRYGLNSGVISTIKKPAYEIIKIETEASESPISVWIVCTPARTQDSLPSPVSRDFSLVLISPPPPPSLLWSRPFVFCPRTICFLQAVLIFISE